MSQSPKARPTPGNPTMDFPDARKAVIDGKKVAREVWPNSDYIFLDKPGYLSIFREGEKTADALLISDGDMLNDDWVIINLH